MRRASSNSQRGASLVETVILLTLILFSSLALKHFSQSLIRTMDIASCKVGQTDKCDGGGTIGISYPVTITDKDESSVLISD